MRETLTRDQKKKKMKKKKKAGDKIERVSNNLEFDQSPTNTAAVLVVESLYNGRKIKGKSCSS